MVSGRGGLWAMANILLGTMYDACIYWDGFGFLGLSVSIAWWTKSMDENRMRGFWVEKLYEVGDSWIAYSLCGRMIRLVLSTLETDPLALRSYTLYYLTSPTSQLVFDKRNNRKIHL